MSVDIDASTVASGDDTGSVSGIPGQRLAAGDGRRLAPRRLERRLVRAQARAVKPRPPVKRDLVWGIGVLWSAVAILVIAFVFHAAVFSALQFQGAQIAQHQQLRSELARAETPTGALDVNGDLVAAGRPVALLEIPALGLSTTVQEGTSAKVLRGGVGHRRDTVMPGQPGTSVLMGRQLAYGGPFRDLKKLKPGDQVSVVTGQGKHVYRIFNLRRAGDPLPAPLTVGRGRLELLTADGLSLLPSGVLHVDAELVSASYEAPAKVITYPALPKDERAMGSDGSAWLVVTFWGLLFVSAAGLLWWLRKVWGPRQAWVVGIPTLLLLASGTADAFMSALPNLI